jgi:hypothetical protein
LTLAFGWCLGAEARGLRVIIAADGGAAMKWALDAYRAAQTKKVAEARLP